MNLLETVSSTAETEARTGRSLRKPASASTRSACRCRRFQRAVIGLPSRFRSRHAWQNDTLTKSRWRDRPYGRPSRVTAAIRDRTRLRRRFTRNRTARRYGAGRLGACSTRFRSATQSFRSAIASRLITRPRRIASYADLLPSRAPRSRTAHARGCNRQRASRDSSETTDDGRYAALRTHRSLRYWTASS